MTYLGVSVRVWLGWAVLSAILSAAVVGSDLLPQPAECGYVLEEGVWLEASCVSEEELGVRLAALREERSSRWGSRYQECAALLEAGDWDATGCVSEWPDLDARSRQLWGPDGDPETGELQ